MASSARYSALASTGLALTAVNVTPPVSATHIRTLKASESEHHVVLSKKSGKTGGYRIGRSAVVTSVMA